MCQTIYCFIARKISQKSFRKGKLSRISNTIAIVSVAISVAVIIVAIAVANGFRDQIRYMASGFNGDIVLAPPGVDIINQLYPVEGQSYADSIGNWDFIENISPTVYRSALLRTAGQVHGIMIKGVGSGYDFSFFEKHLVSGRLPSYSSGDSVSTDILVSRSLANMLGYELGESITAFFVGERLSFRTFRVCGIFDARLESLDKKFIIADLRIVQSANGWGKNEYSGYEIMLKKSKSSESGKYSRIIEDYIVGNTLPEDNVSLIPTTVEERFYVLFDWLRLLDINVMIILVLMVAVAGFNMISGLLIFIFEKISHIGLLKALGMSDSGVSKVFLYRSADLLLKGMLFGNILALLLCWAEWKYEFITLNPANYSVSYVPISLNVWTIVLLNLISFVVIMLLLLLPCRIISKISPAKTLAAK